MSAKPRNSDLVAKTLKLWDAGLNRQQIAERVGRKAPTIGQILTANGRTSGRTPRHRYDGVVSSVSHSKNAFARIASRT